MRKFAIVGLAAITTLLGGCTVDEVQQGMAKACGYLPAEQAVVTIASAIYPLAGTFLSAIQVQVVIEAGCKAVLAAKSKKGFIDPASISAKITAADGRRLAVPLGGSFVR
jgi:hypothetical protein